jgi:hypothetical protein
MERLRRRPSSCSEEGEGNAVPVILPPLVQRVDEGLERRVASSPSPPTSLPLHLTQLNTFVFNSYSLIQKPLGKMERCEQPADTEVAQQIPP